MSERIVISFLHEGRAVGERELDDFMFEVEKLAKSALPGCKDLFLEECYTEDPS